MDRVASLFGMLNIIAEGTLVAVRPPWFERQRMGSIRTNTGGQAATIAPQSAVAIVTPFINGKYKGETKMRMLMNVKFPHEPFNTLLRKGRAGEIIQEIIKDLKPESIYFTDLDGSRGAVAVVNIEDQSKIPSFAEPFFLNFNADIEFRIAMSAEDLSRGGLDELGRKWG
jgi:hypothetical protein